MRATIWDRLLEKVTIFTSYPFISRINVSDDVIADLHKISVLDTIITKQKRRSTSVSSVKEKSPVQVEAEQIAFRTPTENDGKEMFRIVKESKVLDVNSSYSYLMWGKFFYKTSIIAQYENEVIGFVTGFLKPESPNTLFVWQVAIDEKCRGNGLATKLIMKLINKLKSQNIQFIEATVTPSNKPSSNLFKGLAKRYETDCEIYECFSKDQFPDSSHEAEFAYKIGPLN